MTTRCILHNAKDFVHDATAVTENVNPIVVDGQYIKSQSLLLDQRWDDVRAVPDALRRSETIFKINRYKNVLSKAVIKSIFSSDCSL